MCELSQFDEILISLWTEGNGGFDVEEVMEGVAARFENRSLLRILPYKLQIVGTDLGNPSPASLVALFDKHCPNREHRVSIFYGSDHDASIRRLVDLVEEVKMAALASENVATVR